MRNLLLGLLVLGVVAAVVAWTFPADVAYRYFGDRLAPLRLRDVSGTIWQGQARSVEIGRYDLGSIDWTLQPAPLLQGVAVASMVLEGGMASATGTVQRGAPGEVEVRDVRIRMPAAIAAPVLAIPALQLLGTIEIDIAKGQIGRASCRERV